MLSMLHTYAVLMLLHVVVYSWVILYCTLLSRYQLLKTSTTYEAIKVAINLLNNVNINA